MMGQNHLVTGVCALGHFYVADQLVSRWDIAPLSSMWDTVRWYMAVDKLSAATIPICIGLYAIGLLLPDIDNPKSTLGRLIHVPVPHRTWIHSIYPYIIPAALAVGNPFVAWMVFGIFVHLFWDSFSAMGNCWFYKLFSDYREYPGGAKVKKGHKLKLYRAGEWTEYLLVFLIIAFTVASFIWVRRTM